MQKEDYLKILTGFFIGIIFASCVLLILTEYSPQYLTAYKYGAVDLYKGKIRLFLKESRIGVEYGIHICPLKKLRNNRKNKDNKKYGESRKQCRHTHRRMYRVVI